MEFHSSAFSSSVKSDIEMERSPCSNVEIGSSGSTPRSERKESFTSVDTIRHAASVIKCLRSSSSSLRYQRTAISEKYIVQNIHQFNAMVSERKKLDDASREKESLLDQVYMHVYICVCIYKYLYVYMYILL
jgi:hypothetical protein